MGNGRLQLALLTSTALCVASAPLRAATEIGVAAAVNPMAHGYPPAREMRVLQVGTDVTANEKVVTGARGQAQLLFLDGSALSVGPNSDLVLDSFVYDPSTKNGELALAATKGVFRLVGGQLSKRSPVLFKTPTATIGVRGGIALVEVSEDGVNATFLFGEEMTVTSGGETQSATRPGFTIEAPADGPPSPPKPADDGQLEQTLRQFESGEGGTGGIPNPPTDEDVAQTQIPQQNSLEADPPPLGEPPLPPPAPEEPEEEAAEGNRLAAIPPTEQVSPGDGGSGGGSGDTPPTGVNIAGALSGRFRLGSGGAGAQNGALGDVPFAGATVTGGVLAGSGFMLPVDAGGFDVPPTPLALFDNAAFSGKGWLSPNLDFLFYELVDPVAEQPLLVFAGTPTPASAFPSSGFTAYQFRPDFVLGSDVPFVRTGGAGYDAAAAATGYIDWGANRFLLSKVVIEGQGPSQRVAGGVVLGQTVGLGDPATAGIEGGFRGSARTPGAPSAYFFTASGPTPLVVPGGDGAGFFGVNGPDNFVLGTTVTESGPNGSSAYGPNVVGQKTAGAQGPRTTASLTGFIGGLAQRVGPDESVFTVANRFGDASDFQLNLDAPSGTLSGSLEVNDDTGYGIGLSFGGSGAGESAFFDDDTFAAADNGSSATIGFSGSTTDYSFFLTTADAIEAIGALPSGVSLCDCQYLRWGVLALDIADPSSAPDRVQIQLAGWVAGEIVNQGDLPTAGTATYVGHAFGNVYDGSNFYSAFGGLQINFNFGAPTSSTISITNFDGQNYTANLVSMNEDGIYSGFATELGSDGMRTFTFKAGFFGGGGGVVPRETGGQFTVTGDGYQAAGVMAGALAPSQ